MFVIKSTKVCLNPQLNNHKKDAPKSNYLNIKAFGVIKCNSIQQNISQLEKSKVLLDGKKSQET